MRICSHAEENEGRNDKISYPCLMVDRYGEDNVIVLFYNAGKGIIVSSDYSEDISLPIKGTKNIMENYRPFYGTITINSAKSD